ncbi:methyltransferase domain-containing protein [Saccharicrinis sp. FJH54]|uniref:methyltransferase domain-containing protein n=1 Tax=Saccharicrinis sp. FJH54 TaxID=3344665 RepID=UPI0035D3F4AA
MKQFILKKLDNLGYRLVKQGQKDDTDLYLSTYGSDSVYNKRFYNVSAGGHFGFGNIINHPLWRNLDIKRPVAKHLQQFDPQKDFEYDMLKNEKLPIESDSAEIILSQYSIEHVSDASAEIFFREAHRSLKENGILKLITPNSDLDYLALMNNNRDFYWWAHYYNKNMGFTDNMVTASLEQLFISHFAANASIWHGGGNPNQITDHELREMAAKLSKDELFEFCTTRCSLEIQKQHRNNHINWWTHQKIKAKLHTAGFNEVYFTIPHQSSAAVLKNNRYFDNWNDVAFFVEAIKR